MIAALLLGTQVITGAGPVEEARPATDWQCDFVGVDGASFQLRGSFPEAPAGSNPNTAVATVVEGDGPTVLVGNTRVNVFASYPDIRTYQTAAYGADGSSYVTTFGFMRGERLGLATVTRYAPDPVTKRGKLHAFATGHCRAIFHPVGYGKPGK